MKTRCIGFVFLGLLAIPLDKKAQWTDLGFSQSRKTLTSFSSEGLRLAIDKSSSPLFYPLSQILKVHTVKLEFELSGLPKIPEGSTEGLDHADDFSLRLGLVVSGDNQLSWFQKFFAPRWLKLISEKSEPYHLGKALFLTVSQTLPEGTKRKHPKSNLLEEVVVLRASKPGAYSVSWRSPEELDTYALWVQSDGDDTASSFDVLIKNITLESR